eukprot:Opistho-2@40774
MSILQRVHVELGAQHYAEPYNGNTFLKMPANAIVNAAYVVVGAHWLNRSRHDAKFRAADFFMGDRGRKYFCTFPSLAIAYAPIQFGRIVLQDRAFAVLDQWVTLPIFAVASYWAHHVANEIELKKKAAAKARDIDVARASTPLGLGLGSAVALSVASFAPAFFHPRGFEVALCAHIASAAWGGVRLLQLSRWDCALVKDVGLALASCAGFVALKLLDHHIPLVCGTLSGHFWSKICDALQVHYMCRLMFRVHSSHWELFGV